MIFNLIASALAEKLYYIFTGFTLREEKYPRRYLNLEAVTGVLKKEFFLTPVTDFYYITAENTPQYFFMGKTCIKNLMNPDCRCSKFHLTDTFIRGNSTTGNYKYFSE